MLMHLQGQNLFACDKKKSYNYEDIFKLSAVLKLIINRLQRLHQPIILQLPFFNFTLWFCRFLKIHMG